MTEPMAAIDPIATLAVIGHEIGTLWVLDLLVLLEVMALTFLGLTAHDRPSTYIVIGIDHGGEAIPDWRGRAAGKADHAAH